MPERDDRALLRAVRWPVAVLLVPALLAGVWVLGFGPGLEDGLRERSAAALAAAGYANVDVRVSGRDVVLLGVPAGTGDAAAGTVAAVDGVGDVVVPAGTAAPLADARPGAVPDGAPTGTAPTADAPTDPGPAPLPAADRARLERLLADASAARPILFAPDRADLTGPAADTVAQVAELLLAAPAAPVDVVGHAADTPGPAGRALALSEARAAVVRDALVAAGVDAARIGTRGAGDTQPLATLAASRRVEIHVR